MNEDPEAARALAELSRSRAQREAATRWFASVRVIALAVLTVSGFQADFASGHPHDRVLVAVLLAVFAVSALGVVFTFGGTWPAKRSFTVVLHTFTLVLYGTSAALVWLLPSGPADIGLFIAVALSTRLVPAVASAAVAVASAAMITACLLTQHESTTAALLSGLAFLSVYVILVMAWRLRSESERAAQLLAELQQTRGAQAQAAALAERQRLAREMHDVLAHSLSGLMLQLEGARLLARENPADPRLPETIERAHHLGKSGLAEARKAIGMLRDADLPGPEQLPALAERFERDSGVPCHLTVSGEARPLAAHARLALYRVAQEALTNVTKHARAERVDIALGWDGGRARLTVEDFCVGGRSPAPADAAGTGGGYGLTGMRERAELLGGSLTAGPTGHGFRVELEVPT